MFLGCTSTGRVGLCFLWFLCPGTPEGSTGSGSGFKASQKTGQRLKVSSDRLGEAGNQTRDPWFTWHRFIPYTFFVAFLGINQFRLVGLRFVCWLYYGNIQRLTESCFYGEAGNRTCDPWFTRHSAYPLHHGGNNFSPTPSPPTFVFEIYNLSYCFIKNIW